MGRPWIKLWTEALNDPKMILLTDGAYRRFIELLLFAGEVDKDGLLGPYTHIAVKCRVDARLLTSQLEELQHAELLHADDNHWYVTNWHKRQPPTTATDRVKRFREKKRKEAKEKKEEKDIYIDQDKERYVTATRMKRFSNVSSNGGAANAASGGLSDEEKVKIQTCEKLIRRWLGKCGKSRPTDTELVKEHYVEPAWYLLELVGWDTGRAFDMLQAERLKQREQNGYYMHRISTLNNYIFADYQLNEMKASGQRIGKSWLDD